jgi:hypothetical protein
MCAPMTGDMSQPYEFFPGAAQASPASAARPAGPVGQSAAAFGTPVAAAGFGTPVAAFGQPASPYGVAPPTVALPHEAPSRPPIVSALAGLLVAQAALAAGPAVTLLLLRDVIGAAMNAIAGGLGGESGLTGLEASSASSGSGKLTLWGFSLLLLTVLSALSAVAVLDRRVFGLVAAGLAEVGLLVWGLAHFGSVPTVAAIAVLFALAIGGLLATPDSRRWCLNT